MTQEMIELIGKYGGKMIFGGDADVAGPFSWLIPLGDTLAIAIRTKGDSHTDDGTPTGSALGIPLGLALPGPFSKITNSGTKPIFAIYSQDPGMG